MKHFYLIILSTNFRHEEKEKEERGYGEWERGEEEKEEKRDEGRGEGGEEEEDKEK